MSEKAFIDARCKGCGARVGWFGLVIDQPACHRCGRKPDAAALQADQEEMDNFRELLGKMDTTKSGWRKARVAAGLTLRQAAKLLNITPTSLSNIEQGQSQPLPEFAQAMANCYAGDQI